MLPLAHEGARVIDHLASSSQILPLSQGVKETDTEVTGAPLRPYAVGDAVLVGVAADGDSVPGDHVHLTRVVGEVLSRVPHVVGVECHQHLPHVKVVTRVVIVAIDSEVVDYNLWGLLTNLHEVPDDLVDLPRPSLPSVVVLVWRR